ncbi:DUF6233 domain-containing protein [Streptomyces sp. NPDC056987]|uniref:DUF6233 domain-containing protein n=1 Tax=Streptomyces sp. NPDC056987 TaxID=3345988 RepID=UPI003628F3AA
MSDGPAAGPRRAQSNRDGGQRLPAGGDVAFVRIRFADGQELTGRLLARWQTAGGRWMYECAVTLWSTVQVRDQDVAAEPYDIVISAPATHVEPVPGQSYTGVPVRRNRAALVRARTGRRPAPPPAPSGALAERIRAVEAGGMPPVRIHRHDCWVPADPAALFPVTTAQMPELLAVPGSKICDVCNPQTGATASTAAETN